MSTMQLKTTNKIRVQNVRAKLQSLKNITKGDENTLLQIQKSIQKHNTIEDPQTTVQQFNKKQQDDIIIEDKLWNYFKLKSEQYQDKIEKEKINGWYRIIKSVLLETQKKINANEKHIESMDAMIRNKYKQTHQIFKEIESIKLQKASQRQKGSRRKRGNVQTSRGQKMSILKQNIEDLKGEIEEKNEENQKLKLEVKKLKEQRKSFLINLVHEGYYLNDGILFFLQKMAQIGYNPTAKIFPDFLDNRSKQFLLQQYHHILQKHTEQKLLTQRSQNTEKTRTKSNIELGNIAKQQHFKDIYNSTKDYILKLLLQQQWKKQQIKLPKIGNKVNNEINRQQRIEAEKKRIKIVYEENILERVRKIQFGVKLDMVLE